MSTAAPDPRRRSSGAGLPTHPLAWWGWALALGAAANHTTNPLLLVLIIAVAGVVVAARRPSATWARGFRSYLIFGLVVVAIRTVFHIIFGGGAGETVLISLPEIDLPSWAAGIRFGGAVTAEGLAAALYDGLRLATLLICVGAAVTLADPRRLLKTLPGALYEAGLIVVVAVSMAPSMIESAVRVRRARMLRGSPPRGMRAFRAIAMPVLGSALDRAVALAAAMDSRGYGRAGAVTPRARLLSGSLMLAGLLGLCVAAYGLLRKDPDAEDSFGVPALIVGVVASVAGLTLGSRRTIRTRYRPDRFDLRSIAALACGVGATVAFYRTSDVAFEVIAPTTFPLVFPQLHWLPLLGVAVALLPALLTTSPERAGPMVRTDAPVADSASSTPTTSASARASAGVR